MIYFIYPHLMEGKNILKLLKETTQKEIWNNGKPGHRQCVQNKID